MDKFIKIEINNDQPKITFSDDVTYLEGISLSLHQMYFLMETLANKSVERVIEEHKDISKEEATKNIKANIYDKIVLMFSELMNRFFPEAEELDKRTPEALLEALDEKVKELNALSK